MDGPGEPLVGAGPPRSDLFGSRLAIGDAAAVLADALRIRFETRESTFRDGPYRRWPPFAERHLPFLLLDDNRPDGDDPAPFEPGYATLLEAEDVDDATRERIAATGAFTPISSQAR